MGLPEWTSRWAWNGFLKRGLLGSFRDDLTIRQRWEIVLWSLWPGIKHHYLRPAEAWLHLHLPTPLLFLRLERCGAGWHRVPSTSAAIHVRRRLGVHLLEGDVVRIVGGVVTMRGFVDEDLHRCEFWRLDEE